MSTLVWPIFPWLLQVVVIGYFVAVAAYLASAGKSAFKVVGPNNSSINCSCPLVIVIQHSLNYIFNSIIYISY